MVKKSIPHFYLPPMLTIFILCAIVFIMGCVFFNYYKISPISETRQEEKIVIVNNPSTAAKSDSFNDLYVPPLKNNSSFFPSVTSGPRSSYSQIGIITRNGGDKEKLILPLMGRLLHSRRDKWQYYTVSNTGSVNSKLPLRFKGRSCLDENGCDEILNNDSVYVEGYNETFAATIYQNKGYMYEPTF